MFKHCLIVFLVSMVPIIELRGAIPYGVGFGLPLWLTYIIAIVGNMLPVPLIYFFARKVLHWGADKKYIGKFFSYCLEKGEAAGHRLMKRAGRGGLFLALMLFVGHSIPGTGAWTGTLAASFGHGHQNHGAVRFSGRHYRGNHHGSRQHGRASMSLVCKEENNNVRLPVLQNHRGGYPLHQGLRG